MKKFVPTSLILTLILSISSCASDTKQKGVENQEVGCRPNFHQWFTNGSTQTTSRI